MNTRKQFKRFIVYKFLFLSSFRLKFVQAHSRSFRKHTRTQFTEISLFTSKPRFYRKKTKHLRIQETQLRNGGTYFQPDVITCPRTFLGTFPGFPEEDLATFLLSKLKRHVMYTHTYMPYACRYPGRRRRSNSLTRPTFSPPYTAKRDGRYYEVAVSLRKISYLIFR